MATARAALRASVGKRASLFGHSTKVQGDGLVKDFRFKPGKKIRAFSCLQSLRAPEDMHDIGVTGRARGDVDAAEENGPFGTVDFDKGSGRDETPSLRHFGDGSIVVFEEPQRSRLDAQGERRVRHVRPDLGCLSELLPQKIGGVHALIE